MAKKPKINKDLCTGCGLCIDNCDQKALELKDSIAVLVKPEVCDGKGVCKDNCPADAIEMAE